MHKFRECYPDIEIELNSNDQVIDLLQHKTDVAFRFGELNDSSLHAKLVCKSRLFIVASRNIWRLRALQHNQKNSNNMI